MQDASDYAAATFMHFSSCIISAVAGSLDEALAHGEYSHIVLQHFGPQ